MLRGEGPSFCSGGDLDEFGTRPDPGTAHLVRLTRSAARLVHRLRDRVEVDLHGWCVGAGIELPSFAGTVRAAADTRIALPELQFGLVPGAGGTVEPAAAHRPAADELAGDVGHDARRVHRARLGAGRRDRLMRRRTRAFAIVAP